MPSKPDLYSRLSHRRPRGTTSTKSNHDRILCDGTTGDEEALYYYDSRKKENKSLKGGEWATTFRPRTGMLSAQCRYWLLGFLCLVVFLVTYLLALSTRTSYSFHTEIGSVVLHMYSTASIAREFASLSKLEPLPKQSMRFAHNDHISLQNVSFISFQQGRMVRSYDESLYNDEREKFLDAIDDSDPDLEEYYHQDELDDSTCRRPSWHDDYFPACNNFHEIDLSRSSRDVDPNYDAAMLGHGYFRDVWQVTDDLSPTLVLKTTRFRHKLGAEFLFMMRRDALVMTKLSSSPRINDIYGACAGSIAVAAAEKQMLDTWIPSFKKSDNGPLSDSDVETLEKSDRLLPQNRLTLTEKIETAISMAEAIADLHGYEGGVIVHDDLMPDQWLQGHDGQLILGDFNRAYLLNWDDENDKYCKISYERMGSFYDAPEVHLDIPNDEMINVYSYGGHIYALLTGLRTFYPLEHSDVKEKIGHNIRPFVDDRWRNRSYVESEMVKIMERCWDFDPAKRPSIFEVVRMLRDVRGHLQEQKV